jgi:hypothetical protein
MPLALLVLFCWWGIQKLPSRQVLAYSAKLYNSVHGKTLHIEGEEHQVIPEAQGWKKRPATVPRK